MIRALGGSGPPPSDPLRKISPVDALFNSEAALRTASCRESVFHHRNPKLWPKSARRRVWPLGPEEPRACTTKRCASLRGFVWCDSRPILDKVNPLKHAKTAHGIVLKPFTSAHETNQLEPVSARRLYVEGPSADFVSCHPDRTRTGFAPLVPRWRLCAMCTELHSDAPHSLNF